MLETWLTKLEERSFGVRDFKRHWHALVGLSLEEANHTHKLTLRTGRPWPGRGGHIHMITGYTVPDASGHQHHVRGWTAPSAETGIGHVHDVNVSTLEPVAPSCAGRQRLRRFLGGGPPQVAAGGTPRTPGYRHHYSPVIPVSSVRRLKLERSASDGAGLHRGTGTQQYQERESAPRRRLPFSAPAGGHDRPHAGATPSRLMAPSSRTKWLETLPVSRKYLAMCGWHVNTST